MRQTTCTLFFLLSSVEAARPLSTFPQRTNDDSSLLEWGHSAVIHAADAVVAQFGLKTTDQEFELGIEANPVFAKPSQGCERLRNQHEVKSQMVFMFRGACDFRTKVEHAIEAGAVAVVVINHDQTRPDHAFAMAHPTATEGSVDTLAEERRSESSSRDAEAFSPQIPCVMVSWNSGQAILEDRPERLRLYPGGGRPFIESVSDESPVVFIIHNLLTDEEIDFMKNSAESILRPSTEADDDVLVKFKAAERNFDTAWLHRGVWKNAEHKALDDKIYSIINFPPEYYGELQVNRFNEGGLHGLHYDSDRRASQYRERVMTVVFFLDDVEAHRGGGVTFPKGGLHVRPRKGMAVVYHNTMEDGSLDTKSAHLYEALTEGAAWTATQYIYAAPVPLAKRAIVPLAAMLSGGDVPLFLRSSFSWTTEQWGLDRGAEIFNYALLALAALALLPMLALALAALLRTQSAPPAPVRAPSKQKAT